MISQKQSDNITAQLNRIIGQVEGVKKMYESDAECVEIARQILAARSSLASVARKMLTGEVTRCSQEQNVEEVEQLMKELFRH